MKPGKEFLENWAAWESRMMNLEDCPQSEVDEIKQAIRGDWNDLEKRAYWQMRVADEAEHSRSLWAMGRGIADRIKESIAKEKA